jgi:hypothetical protein
MSKKPPRPQRRYRPAGVPGLVLHPALMLLNLVVHTLEDNAKTDGLIPHETVDIITALIRHAYDLADLDRERGKGVAISLIGQFFHPDDYQEHHIAETHSRALRQILAGNLEPMTFDTPDLRTFDADDPSILALADEKTMSLYYKQRFLSICFAGEAAELDKLRGDMPTESWERILGVLGQALEVDDKTMIEPHPALVPANRARRVSQQNAVRWARQMGDLTKHLARQGQKTAITITDPLGMTHVFRPRERGQGKR